MGNRSGKTVATVDEIIETIKRSNLPTVIAEGKDDLVLLRHIEEECSDVLLSILPVGGRDSVLRIFERRDELLHTNSILFVADKDSWVLTGIPDKYLSDQLIFTDGYSIENDIYCDMAPCRLMTNAERNDFNNELDAVLRWYAYAFDKYLAGNLSMVDISLTRFFDDKDPTGTIDLADTATYPDKIHDDIASDYKRLLRGKLLLDLVIRQISYSGRKVKYQRLSLFENAGANPGKAIGAIFALIRNWARSHTPTPQ